MLEEIVRNKMVCAMKDKNVDAKSVYSMLLDKLVSARKEKRINYRGRKCGNYKV